MKKFSYQTIEKILIPTDGSEHSIRAAEYAISIAKMNEAQIMVLYVIDEIVLDQFSKSVKRDAIEMELKNDGKRFVNYALALAEKEGIKATSMIIKGRPFEQIVNIAKSLNIDLIVMGTYGRRGADRILMGSVTARVIEYSSCPVLAVK
jgi:nucleotide-binding universal stress UspA family protein